MYVEKFGMLNPNPRLEISYQAWTCNKSLSRQKREKNKKRERLVILGMLINIHELLSLASIFKMTGLLSTVSSKLEWAIVIG